MYRVGAKPQTKRRRWPWWTALILLVLLLIIGGVVLGTRVHTATNITQAAAVTTKVNSSSTAQKVFSEPGFELKLPDDWKLQEHVTGEYNIYRFQGTGKLSTGRQLDVYQDSTPINFAVNRVQPVEASGSHLAANGSISDNCAEFTKAPPGVGQSGTPAKWQNVDFLCDLHNTTRNVVGTSATGSVNAVKVQGVGGTTHTFFIAFTDHGLAPDYGALYGAIESFTAQ